MMAANKELRTIGARIRFRREQLNLDQAEFAGKLKVSPSMISLWENGRRPVNNVDLLRRLSKALNTTVSWLLGDSSFSAKSPQYYNGIPILRSLSLLDYEEHTSPPAYEEIDIFDSTPPEHGWDDGVAASLFEGYKVPIYKIELAQLSKFLLRSSNVRSTFPLPDVERFEEEPMFAIRMPNDFLSDSENQFINIYQNDIILVSFTAKINPGDFCVVGLSSGEYLVGRLNDGNDYFFSIESLRRDPIKIRVAIKDYMFVFKVMYSQSPGHFR